MIKRFPGSLLLAPLTLLTVWAFAPAMAQKPIKVDLLPYFNKILPPPATAAEAYTKADCGTPDSPHDCELGKTFEAFEAEMAAFNMQISSPDAAATMADGGNLSKAVQDPAFQEKLKNMSDADKMKMAMAMQKDVMKNSRPSASYEKPAVTNVLKEIGTINDLDAKSAMADMNAAAAENQDRIAFDAQQDSVDAGEDAEVDKLPKPFTVDGEAGNQHVPDPAVEKSVRMKHWEKHITLVNDRLARLGKEWIGKRTLYVSRYKKFATDLAAIHYGDDANGEATRRMLASGQSRMVSAIQNLGALSRQQWELGAQWQQRKIRRALDIDNMVAGRHN